MSELHTGTDHLLGRIEGRVAVLSFNRPDSRNARPAHDNGLIGQSPARGHVDDVYAGNGDIGLRHHRNGGGQEQNGPRDTHRRQC